MQTTIFNQQQSIFNRFIAEIRDTSIQTDPMRFRRNIERMGEIMAYEISKVLPHEVKDVTTPLGVAKENIMNEEPRDCIDFKSWFTIASGVIKLFRQS